MDIERNASCPCGSGRRYKACHGAFVPGVASAALPAREPRQLMGIALRSQQAGDLALAEALYREALERLPGEPDCLHMLGVVCYQTGRYREAAELILRAIDATDGRIPAMHRNLQLVASRFKDEPAFWDADDGTPVDAPFAQHSLWLGAQNGRNPVSERGVRVLIVDWAVPRPDRDSGSMRMAAMLRLWKEIGCSVTLATMAMDHDAGRDAWLAEAGIDVLSGQQFPAGPAQVLATAGSGFDVVVVSRLAVALACTTLLRRFAPRALFVFDTVDLHLLRLQREARLTGDPVAASRAAIVRQQELGIVRSADATLVVSAVEQALLQDEVPGARVEVLSNVHQVAGRSRGFEQRKDVFFVGGFAHAPNVDAMHWYAAEVWPRVRRRLPGLQTFIVGSDMPASVAALASDGIVAVGHAPDLGRWLDGCRVAIAPLRFGAGVKGKVNIALASGVPVVATTIAAEGMHLEHGRNVLLGDTAEEFSDAIVRLHEEQATWTAISDAGLDVAQRHFGPQAAWPVQERLRDQALSRRAETGHAVGAVQRTGDGSVRDSRVARRRLLILAPASYGSLGDEAMVRGITSCIGALDGEAELDLLSIYGGEKWPVLPGIRRVIELDPGGSLHCAERSAVFKRVSRHYDALAILGADVLDGHYAIDESLQRLELASAANGHGCATAILGFSVNDRPAAEAVAALAALAAAGARLCPRDPVTQRRLESRGVGDLALAADLAFLMPPSPASRLTDGVEAWMRSEQASGRHVVACCVSSQAMAALRQRADDGIGDLIARISDLVEHHGASLLWCTHDLRPTPVAGESDGELAVELSKRVAGRVGGDRHQHLAPPMGADETKRVVGRADMVVSARMHLAIAALGMGKPVVGIGYQGKFEGLWEHFGLQGNLFDARSLDCARLHDACIDTLGRREDLGAQVTARLPTVVALARRQVELWLAATAGARAALPSADE